MYVSVFGDERGREIAIAGLKSKAKYVRSELGRRMKLRLTPEIRFIEDESLERGSRVRIALFTMCLCSSWVMECRFYSCKLFIHFYRKLQLSTIELLITCFDV